MWLPWKVVLSAFSEGLGVVAKFEWWDIFQH